MLFRNALKRAAREIIPVKHAHFISWRALHVDGRNRLSQFWTPTQRQTNTTDGEPESGHNLLARAGFLRQAHSGIFHLLPLGLRVQNKIESLIDKHMRNLGAAKVSLSSLSSEELWAKSGRLDKGRSSELLRLEDRKGAKYLLSPTHEEEITTIIANAVHSYKELPLRLYQVTRKYRDEPRPRQGLLRSREFLMKDLYTFDITEDAAKQTYGEVRKAYAAFLSELKLPYLTAAASSGNMGGNLSHEYHLASSNGEDTIIKCGSCGYAINEEIYVGRCGDDIGRMSAAEPIATETYVSKDRRMLCTLHYPAELTEPNVYAVKEIWPWIDPGVQGQDAITAFENASSAEDTQGRHIHMVDPRLDIDNIDKTKGPRDVPSRILQPPHVLMTKARNGDACPECKTGHTKLHQAVEIGHTFHLGTRYSAPLSASVLDASNKTIPIQMGCHGIGISRLIGAIASLLADRSGLNWPLAISPFQTIILPGPDAEALDVQELHDGLEDAVIDDRVRPLGWKLKDADLVGYPVVMVMGRRWKNERVVEVQCRRLGLKEEVPSAELWGKVAALQSQL